MKLLFFHLIVLFAFLFPAASGDTRFAFPSFAADDDSIMTFGDAAHSTASDSYIINGGATHSRGSCGELLHRKKVRIQDVATGRVASFSTSFSFTFTGDDTLWNNSSSHRDRNLFAFIFYRSTLFSRSEDLISKVGEYGACKFHLYQSDRNHLFTPSDFYITYGMDYKRHHKDPSNNYIRINKNHDYEYEIAAYTHNLCGNDTHCSYFSNGRIFTTWIDFNSSSQTLEVWLANGSTPSAQKPLKPLLLIPSYEMLESVGDDVYLTFWGSSDVDRVGTHELLSWSFFSSDIPESVPPVPQTLLRVWKARSWAGMTAGVMGIVAATAVVILWFISQFAGRSKNCRSTTLGHSAGPHVFSYSELRKATDNFDERNLLGSGASGSVFKGSFHGPSGAHLVAVKQINFSEPKQAESVFHAEVSSLGQIRHRNVVQLQGWCEEKDRLLLVYDYMPNGGLNEWLHPSSDHDDHRRRFVLSLKMRQSILEGVGAALEYLHEDCVSCILHRDIKSSNVLLDADFKAHLGDFGLARLMDHHKLDRTTLAAGTIGYMAPEMPYTGKATKESDVYSFGILVLEVMCGRRPLDLQATKCKDLVLLHSVWRAYEGESLFSIVDPKLLQTLKPSRAIPFQNNEDNLAAPIIVDVNVEVYNVMVENLLRLGLVCCLPNPKARPSMGQVNGILQQIRDMEYACAITTIAMPSLPTTKPLGLYHTLEFSQVVLSVNLNTPPMSVSHTKFLVNNSTLQQASSSFCKDD